MEKVVLGNAWFKASVAALSVNVGFKSDLVQISVQSCSTVASFCHIYSNGGNLLDTRGSIQY